MRVGQHDLKVTFQDVPHRLPINARGLHRNVLYPALKQPCNQVTEFSGGATKRRMCFSGLPDCASKTQTVIEDLCTSKPQHRGYNTSMTASFRRVT